MVAVVAAFALPSMMRKQQAIIDNNPAPPISRTITIESTPSPSAITTSGESITQSISLEANKGSVLISNKILGNVTHTYTVQAKSGQFLNAAITGDGIAMSVMNTQGIALPDAANVAIANIPIPSDGTYTVQLRDIGELLKLPIN